MFAVVTAILFVVSATIAIHYEALRFASRRASRRQDHPRMTVISGVVIALIAHVLEVWLFAATYFLLSRIDGTGSLGGAFSGGLTDYSYYSFTVYTSLGFGDITPVGPLRLVTAMEALTGLVLIAWTASFMFLQLQEQWKRH